jgi:hypothetical protein
MVTRVSGRILCTFAALILSALVSLQLDSQVVGGTLSGAIADTSGAAIPGAQVIIKNVATGVSTAVTTNCQGIYNAPNLLPGNCDVTVSAGGFATEVQRGVTLTVGSQQVLNFTVKAGTVTQEVQATGSASAVQLATSAISGAVNP